MAWGGGGTCPGICMGAGLGAGIPAAEPGAASYFNKAVSVPLRISALRFLMSPPASRSTLTKVRPPERGERLAPP